MSFHQCTEMFVQLNVLCLGNWLHEPLRKKCGEVLVFSIFHPTRLFRPTQLLIWMNLPPYTIIPHCTAIRHFTVARDRRYGPSQIDYILASCRWASSAYKSRVKWGVSRQRWGCKYDHGLVSCDWHCRVTSRGQQEKHIDYLPLER